MKILYQLIFIGIFSITLFALLVSLGPATSRGAFDNPVTAPVGGVADSTISTAAMEKKVVGAIVETAVAGVKQTGADSTMEVVNAIRPGNTISTAAVEKKAAIRPGKGSEVTVVSEVERSTVMESPAGTTAMKGANSRGDDNVVDSVDELYPLRHELKEAMRKYIDFHNSVTRRQSRSKQVKYLSFTPSGQLCNRIRGTLTAFTLAFLTNRVFTVQSFGYKGTRSFYNLFKSPGFDIETGLTGRSGRGDGSRRIPLDLGNNLREKIIKAEVFTCTDWHAENASHLHLSGTDYSSTFFYRNPSLQKRINELFVDEDMFRPLLYWLFRPNDDIVRMKDDFLSKYIHIPHGKYMVGFHVRNEFPVTETEWEAYKTCAKAVTPHTYRGHSVWFVATDSDKAQSRAQQMLRNDTIVYNVFPFMKGAELAGLKQALVEILIVSSSDRIFLTPFSSFSRIIAMYARSPHVYLVTDGVMPEEDTHRRFTEIVDVKHCYRYMKKEECAWPGHETSINKILPRLQCYDSSMISDIC